VARRDFAESGARQASSKRSKGGGTGQVRNTLLVVGILLVVAGSFVGGFWLGKGHPAKQTGSISKEARDQLLAEIQKQQQELTALKAKFKKQQGEKAPAASEELNASANNAPASTSVRGKFRVQVGSYQRRSDAEELAARFRQAGIPSRVEETQVPELGAWFRVYLGPYTSRAEAEATIKVVQQRMHITGLLLRGE
jgi:cell division septation protein DedD